MIVEAANQTLIDESLQRITYFSIVMVLISHKIGML